MAQTFVAPLLRRLLQIPPETDLQFSVRDCRVVLTDVQLQTGPLEDVLGTTVRGRVPLQIQSGGIKELIVQWSWKGFLTCPVQVSIRELNICLGALDSLPQANHIIQPIWPAHSFAWRFARRILQTLHVTIDTAVLGLEGPNGENITFCIEHFSTKPDGNVELVELHNISGYVHDAEGWKGLFLKPFDPMVRAVRQGGRSLEDLLGLDITLEASGVSLILNEQELRCLLAFAKTFQKIQSLLVDLRSNEQPAIYMQDVNLTDNVVDNSMSWFERARKSFNQLFKPASASEAGGELAIPDEIVEADRSIFLAEDTPLPDKANFHVNVCISESTATLFNQTRCFGGADAHVTVTAELELSTELFLREFAIQELPPVAELGRHEVITFPEPGPSVVITSSMDCQSLSLMISAVVVSLEPIACQLCIAVLGVVSETLQSVRSLPSDPTVTLCIRSFTAKLPSDGVAALQLSSLQGSIGPTNDGKHNLKMHCNDIQIRAQTIVVMALPNLNVSAVVDNSTVQLFAPIDLHIAMEHLKYVEHIRDPLFNWAHDCIQRLQPLLDSTDGLQHMDFIWHVPAWSLRMFDAADTAGGLELVLTGEAKGMHGCGHVVMAGNLQGQMLFEEWKITWDQTQMSSESLAITIHSDVLRMLKHFAEALPQLSPSSDINNMLPRQLLYLESATIQVICPHGVSARTTIKHINITAQKLRTNHMELELGTGSSGAELVIKGDMQICSKVNSGSFQATIEGSLVVRDLDAHINVLCCPMISLSISSEDHNVWVPGSRVQFCKVKNQAYVGKQGSLVQWDPNVSKWKIQLDGQTNFVSVSQDKLRLCVQPCSCALALESVEANVTDAFLITIDQHLMILQDVIREIILKGFIMHVRPFGLRIKSGDIQAVAGPARVSCVMPGSHVVAIGTARKGNIDLATCILPTVLLSEPPPIQMKATWQISAFDFDAKRIGSGHRSGRVIQEAKIRFAENSCSNWGPGPLFALLKELRVSYVSTLIAQSPQFLSNLRETPIQGAVDMVQAAAIGISSAVQHHKVAADRRQSPISDFDDIEQFPPTDVLHVAPAHTRAPVGAIPVTAGFQAAANICHAAAENMQARSANRQRERPPELHSTPYPPSNPLSAGLQVASAGLQVAAGLSQAISQGAHASNRRQHSQRRPNEEPCRQQ